MYKVTVVDGDTLKIGTHTFRLSNVAAPGVGVFLADEAKEHLEALIDNKEVDLEVVGVIDDDVFVKVSVGGTSVNEEMNKFLKANGNARQKSSADMRLRR